jgi:Fanconi anemia group M protein
LVKELDGKKIVFVQYRNQIERIANMLKENGVKAEMFVGRRGMSRKKQNEIIDRFRKGEIDVIVASSVGEEGLDIPAVDTVIFYEPVPSEIRSIQRRGRTGRFGKGRVIILMTKGTRDVYYYWASVKKEKKMKAVLKGMQRRGGQKKLTDF